MHEPLVRLGRWLKAENFRFTTITPESHARVVKRASFPSTPLRDLLGWSKGVPETSTPVQVVKFLEEAGCLLRHNHQVSSTVRFSTIGQQIYVHSAFPTSQKDAVFLGPDTNRFVRFLRSKLRGRKTLLDIGCGAGVGGLQFAGQFEKVYLGDINDKALLFSRVNAEINNVTNVEFLKMSGLDEAPGGIEALISNPPFIIQEDGPTYSNGGNNFGVELPARIAVSSLAYLDRGELAIYTGTPFRAGHDEFYGLIESALKFAGPNVEYEELDPDIFGDSLETPEYSEVERIAAVGLYVSK